jgi:GNAT superfamily N-acetyltransferase
MLKLMYHIFPHANIRIQNEDRILIANSAGELVGFVHYSFLGNKAIIRGFGVEGNVRGIGIGSMLITRVLKIFELAGIPVYLKVKTFNSAISLYFKFGFIVAKVDELKGVTTLVKRCHT